jgi:hypothetical protein
MAHVKRNPFTLGMSGTIGNQMTLRVRKNKTVVGVKCASGQIPATEQQEEGRVAFMSAAAYATEAVRDGVRKCIYEAAAKGGQSAYNIALKDARLTPKITVVDTQEYKGNIGDLIDISVRDAVRVDKVWVVIYSAAGEMLEQGDATPDGGQYCWVYTTTVANHALSGTRIAVTATDLPGNQQEVEYVIG